VDLPSLSDVPLIRAQGRAQRGHATSVRGMLAQHIAHMSAVPLGVAHNMQACGNARRAKSVPVRHPVRSQRKTCVVALSNFGTAKFDSMR